MIVDMPLAELQQYTPELTAQDDFMAFWQQNMAASDDQPLNATLEAYDYPVERASVYKVRYDGFGANTRVAGWYLVPKHPLIIDGRTPAIVFYHGYSASKGLPVQYLSWALQGYIVFAVDTRGQNGDTPDNNHYESGAVLGCMTRGILDPYSYYYRFAYMDCVRAVDFVRSRPEVGPIVVTGGSQGGGLTIVVAALAKDKGIVAAMPAVPYLCHFQRAVAMFSEGPYQELVNYWKQYPQRVEQSYRTLSYFDGMNFAPHITCPVLLAVSLLDTICPPSTGFAVYHHLTCEKELKLYPYNGHEGGGANQDEEKFRFLRHYIRAH
ncbi:MAG TPA: alpha/beta fold hydrolase [Ktedonobacteraceae bacterium]|jgi:cephalosporin-C deacetylase|nr:alpha/beta fold hydrolase [Ktedonobacteraceae bacterium]